MFFHTFLNSVRKYHKIPSSTIFFPISSCGSCSDHLFVYYEVVRQHHKYEYNLHSALLLSITCNTYLSSSIHFHNHIRVILSLDFVLSCLSCSIRISIYVLGCAGLPLLIYHNPSMRPLPMIMNRQVVICNNTHALRTNTIYLSQGCVLSSE